MIPNKAFKIHTFDIRKYSIYRDSQDVNGSSAGDSQNLSSKQWYHYPQRTALSINFFWFVSTKSIIITIVWKGDTIDKTTIDPLNREIVSLVAKYPAIGLKQTDEAGNLLKRFQVSFSDEGTFSKCHECIRSEMALPVNTLPVGDIRRSSTAQIPLPSPGEYSKPYTLSQQAGGVPENESQRVWQPRQNTTSTRMPQPWSKPSAVNRGMTSTFSVDGSAKASRSNRPIGRSATFAVQPSNNVPKRLVHTTVHNPSQYPSQGPDFAMNNQSQVHYHPYVLPQMTHMQSPAPELANSQAPRDIQFSGVPAYSQISNPFIPRPEQLQETAAYDLDLSKSLNLEVPDYTQNQLYSNNTKISQEYSIYDLKDEKLKQMIKEKLKDEEFIEFVIRLDNLINPKNI